MHCNCEKDVQQIDVSFDSLDDEISSKFKFKNYNFTLKHFCRFLLVV